MKTNVFLVRHAHSVYTPDELHRPLSERGVSDAKKVTEQLKGEGITVCISSPYQRAIQTIEGISQVKNLKIIIEEDFRERLLSGIPVEDFASAMNKVWENPSFCLEGGESNLVAQERGVGALHNVIKAHAGENIVIGTHGNIMILIMNYFDPSFDFTAWQQLDMPDIYKLSFNDVELIEITSVWSREKSLR
ncbi:2,3-bisphosphoglycerate-dependent phosphoglycerate mutase [Paenibacillus turicensis]|uniref:2,3-bisphosphoglycerate-dependent phosphoglycerate mutase n=1 Tax=Paenibacillus turicensis TaxID=160487 RepID=A0ABS4FRE2_9BACL|nr:2,3-bisphosphoglycerate-dependent phosphoglycerate mutase [Paenibacillus turicensis]